MKKIISGIVAVALLAVVAGAETNPSPAAVTAPAAPTEPDVDEVVQALRTHFVDREQLDARAVDKATLTGILETLGRGVTILSAESAAASGVKGAVMAGSLALTNAPALGATSGPVARAEVIEPNIGYLRILDVSAATVSAFDEELRKFHEARVEGYILDLRFANGADFGAAAAVASRFFDNERDLFRLQSAVAGVQRFRSVPVKVNSSRLGDAPLILLVNGQTRGAAEVLVGALRGQDRGIVVGSLTAGSAAAWQDLPLRDGQVLRVATAKIVLEVVSPQSVVETNIFPHGIAPDIFVALAPAIEQTVVLNAATNVTLTVSLQPRGTKKRMSEADLMKVFRGQVLDANLSDETDGEEAEIQKVQDVVLQRAVDVLKGIRVLLSWQ